MTFAYALSNSVEWAIVPIMSAPDFSDLISRAQKRDSEAVAQLYRRYSDLIYRYIAYRVPTTEDAEDLTAEVFVNMLDALPKYKQTGAPFEAWLYRIAAARVADFHRKRKRQSMGEIPEDIRDDNPLPEENVQKQQEIERLRKALSALNEEQQTVLLLRFVNHKSHQEVSEAIGKSETAVRSIQHRALRELAKQLGSEDKARHYLRGGGHE